MRLEGWESRLARLIEEARHRPYVLGENDCFRMACEVVRALTGDDLWPVYQGYTTRREALARLALLGSTFESAFDKVFGSPRLPWQNARRGDIVALQSEDGEKHLGVCNGSTVAGLLEHGLAFFPLPVALCCWRVG